ncbi:MAG: leucine-rich repeat domain-containing protein [Clostridiales bacterium]|nr:leucine-rich repeat domain-containing protein [Clostridiales bacterium]
MNYVLERMKKSRMLALFLVLSMIFSLMPVNMACATQGEGTDTTCSLQFSASDLDMADITYKLGDDTAVMVDRNKADEGGAIWAKDIANDTAITIQVAPKRESQISGVNVKEDSSEGAEAYEGNCTSNEDGSYTYTFTAGGGRTYYVVLNTGNNNSGGEPANTGDVLIETTEAQNGNVSYKIGDSGEWIPLNVSSFTLRASNELEGVTTGTKIYLKATPNAGQAFDDYRDGTQNDSQGNPLTNNTISVQSGETSTVTNIDTTALQEGTFAIDYDATKAYTVNIRFAGNGGGDNPGRETSKEYHFNGKATSTITFNGNTGYDGAGMFFGAIFYINGVAAQERGYDAGNNRDTVTRKTSVTYPYDAKDANTPKITVGETQVPAVEFEFSSPINMRYTEIKINGTDYSGEIPGANPDTRKWDILDAMDLNGNSQTVSFILTVPYAESYDVTANMEIIGNREDEYGTENGMSFSVMNAQNATIGYTYGGLTESDITAKDATFPEALVEGETLTLFAKTVEGQEMLGFHLTVGGQGVDWDALQGRGSIDSEEGFSFTITQEMAERGLQIFLEFSFDEKEAASYFPTGNFLWSNLERDKDSDVYLDHTIIQFVKFTYVNKAGEEVTYNSLDEMNKANHTYLHFDDDENAGEATLIAGGEITVRLIPRYGYQVVEFGPNGDKKSTSDTEACVYTFSIANGNAHIGAKCAPVEDKVASTVEEVKDGNIALAADELDMGTAILNVDETTTTATEQAAFETAAAGYDVESYLDLNLDQVVYRGSAEQMWEKEVTELKEKASISLTVDGDYENGVEIVHQKHDGTYEVIAAQYDKVTKKITFETDSFSKYAICSKASEHVHAGTKIDQVKATCAAYGVKEYYQCSCGKYFGDAACEKEIPDLDAWKTGAGLLAKKEHSLKKTEAKAATCVAAGNKEYWTCSECGKIYSDAEGKTETTVAAMTVAATGHKWDNGTVTKEATATEAGVKTYHCTNAGCTETKTETISATGVPEKGTEIKDDKGNASYKVTGTDTKNPTVTFTGTKDTKAKTVTVPASVTVDGVTYKVTAVADNAFKGNKNVTKVTIPKNVTTIGKNAFSGCAKLKTVTVGSDVTTVGANAFKGCKELTKVTLPSKTTTIGANAFNGCKKLKTITIKSKKMTSKTIDKNAFKGVSAKTTIKVPKGKVKSYKTLFQKKGLSKKVIVK